MPKPIKGVSARKPPTPSSDHAQLVTWVTAQMPAVQPLIARLDAVIRERLPSPQQYAIKWGKAYYGLPELGWVIELAAYHRSANVVFHAGTELDPPPPLGESGRTRYVKLFAPEEADDPQLLDWIEQAGRIPGWS